MQQEKTANTEAAMCYLWRNEECYRHHGIYSLIHWSWASGWNVGRYLGRNGFEVGSAFVTSIDTTLYWQKWIHWPKMVSVSTPSSKNCRFESRIGTISTSLSLLSLSWPSSSKKKKDQQIVPQQDTNNKTKIISHTGTALWDEFELVSIYKKDTPNHVNAAKQWLHHRRFSTQLYPIWESIH